MGSRFGPQSASFRFALGFFLISGAVAGSCINKTGESLPPGLMSFPIAIELSTDLDADDRPQYLYVTSSNFALQYNSGNVQSYDLVRLVDGIFTGCVDKWVLPECRESGEFDDPSCACDPLEEVACVPIQPGGVPGDI